MRKLALTLGVAAIVASQAVVAIPSTAALSSVASSSVVIPVSAAAQASAQIAGLRGFPEPYCGVSVGSRVEPITRVQFAGIDNSSLANATTPHEDFVHLIGNADAGSTLSMHVEGNTFGNFTSRITAFFDWNRNNVLDDPDEMVYLGSITNSNGADGQSISANVNVPAGLTEGPVRVRLIKRWSQQQTNPCGPVDYGQAEDYTLQINAGGGMAPKIVVDPVALTFDLHQGASASQSLGISNTGNELLNWTIDAALPNGRDERAYKHLMTQVRSHAQSLVEGAVRQAASSRSAVFGTASGPALRADECSNAPGAVIHDDGSMENGYSANPAAGISRLRLVDRFTPSGYPAHVVRACVAFLTLPNGPDSLDFKVVVFDDDGPAGSPGTQLGELPATAQNIPVHPTPVLAWTSVDLSSLDIHFDNGSVYIGVSYAPSAPNVFVAADESNGNPAGHAGGYFWNDKDAVWVKNQDTWEEYRALMVRANLPNDGNPPAKGCDNPSGIPWLTVTPASGSLAAGASGQVSVTANASGLQLGTYKALLCVNSNDSSNPRVEVPVEMTVTENTSFPHPYCDANFRLGVEPISRVLIADIDNASSPALGASPALEDFLAVEGTLIAGASYPIAVEGNTDGNFTDKVRAFFDWDRDGSFSGADESFLLSDLIDSTGADGKQAMGNITVPVGVSPGSTRMRVIKRFNEDPVDPCNVLGYGQAEDYTIHISGGGGPQGADLGINAFGTPEVASPGGGVSFAVTLANFGPDAATAVKVEIALPNALSFVSGRWIDGTPRGNGDWNCTGTSTGAVCELSAASLPVHGIAAVLQIEAAVATDAQPGTVESSFSVSSSGSDPVPSNDTVRVATQVVRTALFCDSFEEQDEGCGDGHVPPPPPSPGEVYENRADFVAAIAAGFYEEDFANVPHGSALDAPLLFSGSGFSYSVFTQTGAVGGLYNAPGVISTNNGRDKIVVTFTSQVKAVGGNFWATDLNFAPTSTAVVLTLADGTTHTVDISGEDTFRGFVSSTPILSLTIDAPEAVLNQPPFKWAAMDNLIVGNAN